MEFIDFREKISENTKRKNIVYSKKINRIPVVIYKSSKGYSVEVDGDYLDDYKSQKEAEKYATEFVKEL